MMNSKESKRGRFRHLLETEDDDPMRGVANLFDVAMVLVIALLIASYTQSTTSVLGNSKEDLANTQIDAAIKNETLPQERESLQHYRISEKTLSGAGERLGIAYRLSNGEVVYVPEPINE